MSSANSPTILTTEQLAKVLSVTPDTLRKWHREGRGPAAIRLGRLVRYEIGSVVVWLRNHERVGEQS